MFNIERWQEIFEAIAKNKLRTFLTGISVASGIFILVILLGVGQGLQNGIEQQFAKDAEGIIEISPGKTSIEYKGLNPGRSIQFRDEDFNLSLIKFDKVIDKAASTYNLWSGEIVYGKETGNYQFRGINRDYQAIENVTVIEGRFINNNDLVNNEKTSVIGNKIKTDLFKGKSPIGKQISINGINFKVVGVFTDPGGEREESKIFIPLTTLQKTFGFGDKISQMGYTVKKKATYEEALAESNYFTKQLGDLLKNKYIIAPEDNNAFWISNSMEDKKQFYDMNLYIKLFFWWVGICTIIAGVVGVSNIMLIIVKERTKEIGIRKALGATPISIIGMILHESIFITALSGFMGLLSALILLEIVGPQIKSDYFTNPSVDFKIAIITLVLLVFSGTLAGFFPAYRAAKIKPIVALRDE
jgi:putative ABC transport system permease protein